MKRWVACLLAVGLFAGSAVAAPSGAFPGGGAGRTGGFLAKGDLPDAVDILPPPPATGSAAFAADQEEYRKTRAFRGSARWNLAARDADLSSPEGPGAFSCAVGAPITEKDTPILQDLLLRAIRDATRATAKAKDHYRRIRPFAAFGEASCTPSDDPFIRGNGSFPSGHATTGWIWALILAEIAPDRIDAVLARGLAFGESRVICGVHWQSDVEAGRILGAGVVARLHADPVFRARVEAARVELARVRAAKLRPARDCGVEAAALAAGVK